MSSTLRRPSWQRQPVIQTTFLVLRGKCPILGQVTTRSLVYIFLRSQVSGLPSSVRRLPKSSERYLSREDYLGDFWCILDFFHDTQQTDPLSSIIIGPAEMLLVVRGYEIKPGRLWPVSTSSMTEYSHVLFP